MPKSAKHRPIVAAAILNSLSAPSHLLCAQRAYPEELRGYYELPGGKIEEGEDAAAALLREIHEELATTLILGDSVLNADTPWWPIHGGRRMRVWLAEVAPDAPAPTCTSSHLRLDWVHIDELDHINWIPFDQPIARAIAVHLGF